MAETAMVSKGLKKIPFWQNWFANTVKNFAG